MGRGNYYSYKNVRMRYLSSYIYNRNCSRTVLKMQVVHSPSSEFGSITLIFILKGDPVKQTEPQIFFCQERQHSFFPTFTYFRTHPESSICCSKCWSHPLTWRESSPWDNSASSTVSGTSGSTALA